MKILIYQMQISWEDKEANYSKLEEQLLKHLGEGFPGSSAEQSINLTDHVEEKKTEGEQLVCQREKERQMDAPRALVLLPEMSFTGFSMNTGKTKETEETLRQMKKLAVRFQVAIGFGWVRDCGEKAENHYTIVSHRGEVLSDYVKLHPFSYAGEDELFQKGEHLSQFIVDQIPFGTAICYDLRFPEVFQKLSKEAHVLLIPANWPAARREHWITLLKARAIETQSYVIGINCTGNMGGLVYAGDSMIVNPNGEVVLAVSEGEHFEEYNLSDDVMQFRNSFPVKQDRREEFYRQFYQNLN